MDLLPAQGHAFPEGEEKSPRVSLDNSSVDHSSASPMIEGGGSSERAVPTALSAHEGAREIIRLIQCPRCSKPYTTPVTLPCGHSACRGCLPQEQPRENISYPNTPGRQYGIQCWECDLVHPVGECNVDVTLLKVMESVSATVDEDAFDVRCPLTLEEVPPPHEIPLRQETGSAPPLRHFSGGRLIATYLLAREGNLRKPSNVIYHPTSPSSKECEQMDVDLLNRFRDAAYKELDCQVCYSMMLEPVTTSCGHTFCRKCLARVLDHSKQCPFCRRTLPIAPSTTNLPNNAALSALLNGLCPELVAARAATVALEELSIGGPTIPLFVCTLAFPGMPTFLHVFEPRYRLMLRRAIEGNRRFGMVSYNRLGLPQGDLGTPQFTQFGTLLEIINVQYQPDGRCYVETRGVQRFKVLSHGVLDGYMTGTVERVDDIALAEEEQREAAELSAFAASSDNSEATDALPNPDTAFNALSTHELLQKGTEFIESMRTASASWLSDRIVEAYGGPPDDPATFPYWFATVLPIADDEKYVLLHTTSVRERLKTVNRWIQRIERQRWWVLLNLYSRGSQPSTSPESSGSP